MRDTIKLPMREELIAWGMRPCAGSFCTVLINPHAVEGKTCGRCTTKERERRRNRQKAKGARS